jgi:putative inorganic carbon (hco3(-)) transporter
MAPLRQRVGWLLGGLWGARRLVLGVTMVALLLLLGMWLLLPFEPVAWAEITTMLLMVVAIAYVLWHVEPAWIFSGALALSVFSGNWEHLGFPAGQPPDRLLLLAGILGVLLRSPGAGERPPLRFRAVHVLLAAAGAYAVGSAVATGTLLDGQSPYRLLDRFSIIAFVVFLVAPAAFRTERQRRVLLGTLVVLGGYLGLTALFETIGLRALVFPKYILDPSIGIHAARARGPFLETAGFSSALFACGVAAALAISKWDKLLPRVGAGVVLTLCASGQLFTLLRAAWVGAILALAITMIVFAELRRFVLPAAAAVLIGVTIGLAVVPGLSERVQERKDSKLSEWDRRAQFTAGLNMVEARPLLGFGWQQYAEHSRFYVEMSDDYPLNLSDAGARTLHNVLLVNLVELGLVGTTLWLLGLLLGVGAAIVSRGPPELRAWRIALLAFAVHWACLMTFSQLPAVFPNLTLWLLAAVATGPAALAAPAPRPATRLSRLAPGPA